MKIWVISDTHCNHEELHIPENVDMVIHCGDVTNSKGSLINEMEFYHFYNWWMMLNIPNKYFIAGNHDKYLENFNYKGAGYLYENAVPLKKHGFVIYGTPYTPAFFNWSFQLTKDQEEIWSKSIPPCDILVTHGPPKFILDSVHRNDTFYEHVGSKHLLNRVKKIKPKLHVFGHIHNGDKYPNNNGVYFNGDTWFINASCCKDGSMEKINSHGYIVTMENNNITKIERNV